MAAVAAKPIMHVGQVVASGSNYVYNEVGLLQKLEEILLPADYPWVETLAVTSDEPLVIENVDDDLKREAALYVRGYV